MEKILTLKNNKNEINALADALASSKRLDILEFISSGQEYSHKELSEKIGLTTSSISFHLTPLIDAGILDEQIGKGLKGRNKKVPILKIKRIVIEL